MSIEEKLDKIIAILEQGQPPSVLPFPDLPGDFGIATSGSTTTLVDTRKLWGSNVHQNGLLWVKVDGVLYAASITGNSENQLDFAALPVSVKAGSQYRLWDKLP